MPAPAGTEGFIAKDHTWVDEPEDKERGLVSTGRLGRIGLIRSKLVPAGSSQTLAEPIRFFGPIEKFPVFAALTVDDTRLIPNEAQAGPWAGAGDFCWDFCAISPADLVRTDLGPVVKLQAKTADITKEDVRTQGRREPRYALDTRRV